MASTAREASTTIREYAEDFEETVMRDEKVFAKLVDEGRVELDVAGDGFQWQVQYQRGVVEGNKGDTALIFSPVNRFMPCYLEERGYATTDSMKKREYVKNRKSPALIKYFARMGQFVLDDMKRQFVQEPFIDGDATGNENRLHGLKTFLKHAGNSINSSTGAVRSYNAADYVMAPSATYAGLNTGFQYYGGTSLTGVWPNAFTANTDGDTADFFTPVLVNYVSSSFAGTAQTWAVQCTDAMRFMIDACHKDDGQMDMIILNLDLFRQFKTKNDSLQRINVENSGLRKLGFKDVINLDGVDVTGQFGVTVGEGFGFTTKKLTLRSYQPRMFVVDGPFYDKSLREWRVVCDFIGNLKASSPKYFGRLLTGSAVSEA